MRFPTMPSLPRLTKSHHLMANATSLVERLMQSGGVQAHGRMPVMPQPESLAPGHFLARDYSGAAGSRPYKLYVPTGYHGQAVPLIVMLHGCTQSPDDFAAGTRMNQAAEAATCLVAYPGQTQKANMQRCWNWFNEADQGRGHGEPAIIAGITRDIMQTYKVDPARVFVAGLSAGGAQAAIMANAYPDLYAAAGVHSGLACGAAADMPSAMQAMRAGSQARGTRRATGTVVPTIVFHGDRDTTVSPVNGDQVISDISGAGLRTRVERGQAPGGHAYTRTLSSDTDGRVVAEQWLVSGGAHAWFGGSPAGSYTDPQGPDATREMLRFFLEHPKQT
jgi:poly(hydroxyalkanoate) depolymerase family esterase